MHINSLLSNYNSQCVSFDITTTKSTKKIIYISLVKYECKINIAIHYKLSSKHHYFIRTTPLLVLIVCPDKLQDDKLEILRTGLFDDRMRKFLAKYYRPLKLYQGKLYGS